MSESSICKISVCLKKAEDNGYCIDHQEFAGAAESNESISPAPTSQWPLSLNILAFVFIVGSIIYGLIQYEDFEKLTGDLDGISNSYKYRLILIPGTFGIFAGAVLLSLGKIINLLEKKSDA